MLLIIAMPCYSALAVTVVPSALVPADSTRTAPLAVDNAKINDALKEFKSLSKSERKDRVKEAKQTLKQYKKDKKSGKAEPSTNTVLLVILAILLPPLAVYLHEGEINGKFWLDLVLTLLFFLPGVIYALIVVLS